MATVNYWKAKFRLISNPHNTWKPLLVFLGVCGDHSFNPQRSGQGPKRERELGMECKAAAGKRAGSSHVP